MSLLKIRQSLEKTTPQERLRIEVDRYSSDRWEFRFLVKEPEVSRERLAGCIVLKTKWAKLVFNTLSGMDSEQNVKIEGELK